MGPINDPLVLTQELPFRDNDKPFGIHTQTDGPIGEGGWHAVAIAFEGNQASGRHTLGLLDEAIECPPHGHQAGYLFGVHISNGAGQRAVLVSTGTEDSAKVGI